MKIYDFSALKFEADTTLYAKWQINTYTVTFNTVGGSAVDNQTVEHGKAVAICVRYQKPETYQQIQSRILRLVGQGTTQTVQSVSGRETLRNRIDRFLSYATCQIG